MRCLAVLLLLLTIWLRWRDRGGLEAATNASIAAGAWGGALREKRA